MTLGELNQLDREEFRDALGGVFEGSPWVAERAWAARPFTTVAALHAAMADVVRRASADERLALLRAHPDLAGKAARARALTVDSAAEQASAGLDRLNDADHERFARLNAAYRARFGFPFIIAVRRHDVAGILAAYETRLTRTVAEEIDAALDEVFTIARLRLDALVHAA
jgi:2-oxo-4-hydroxy-4-carboxy-5-ureidoimidazoline decarboxylase